MVLSIRFQASPSVLAESEKTVALFSFQLSEPPPGGGVTVTVNGNVPQNLTQLDLFEIEVEGGDFPEGDLDFSGFSFNITSQNASLRIPIFQDGIAEDPVTVTYILAPGSGYTVVPEASQAVVTFRDSPEVGGGGGNQPPIANDDSGTIAENQIFNGNLLANDSDPNGDRLSVSAINDNSGAIGSQIALNSGALVTLNADGSFSYNPNGQFNYLNAGQTTGDSFTYTISDGRGGSEQGVVSITITGITQPPSNQNPLAVNDGGITNEKTPLGGNVLVNDSDPNGDAITLSSVNGSPNLGIPVTLASGAILTLNADGNYLYNPNGAFNALNDGQTANDSFSYSISDGRGGAATATVFLTIQGVTDIPPGFDPAQYGASYPDLTRAYGYDLAGLSDHYLTAGRFEGRSPDNFDELRYTASNPDLLQAYGSNGAGVTEHYIRHGFFENRSLTGFDPARYVLSYPDLLTAYGSDLRGATLHYVEHGFGEERNPNLFPSDRYIASYPDLIEAFSYNLELGSNHYLNAGRGEGRQITFDPQAYLNRYSDLSAGYGNDLVGATYHYIEHGFEEGRSPA